MGPVAGVDFEDIQGGMKPHVSAVTEIFTKLIQHLGPGFIRETEKVDDLEMKTNPIKTEEIKVDDDGEIKPSSSLIIPVVDPNDTLI